MRKLFILILGFILVFVLVGVDKVSGCGCADSSCDCDSNRCDRDSTTNCADLTTWYHSSSESYTGLSYLNKRSFKESDCVSNGECGPCCDGGEDCDGGCYTKYNCKSNYVTCQEWEDCSSPTSCGNRGNCDCNINYCKGWCKNRVNEGEIPVYNGPSFANCGGAAGDCSFDEDYSKYESQSKGYTHTSYSTCTCSWCTIRNYYECDSSQMDDSHPCSSENCAPDFVGGRNYCCDSEQCAHLGNVVSWSEDRHKDSSVNPDLYCYDSDSIVQYQGYKLKCNDGNWEFIGGEKADFTDNCGKTIFNYPLFFNSPDNNFYPDGYGYKDSYVIYPVSFDGTKDIVASVIPDETVKINEENVRYKVFREETREFDVKFKGDEEGNQFNLSVNCYTPDKYNCDSSHDDCWPGSYCSQDNPTNNFVSDDDIAKVKLGVKILNNNSDVKCWINGENILDETEFKDLVWSDEIALEDYNLIACKVTARGTNSKFKASLRNGFIYFDFSDESKWKYNDSVSGDDWKNNFDSDWDTKNQPITLANYGDILYLRKRVEPNYLFYCCPNNSCAHPQEDKICWEEGDYNLTVSGESDESTKCLWDCKNGIWRKREEGGLCYRHCDCADSDENYCVPTLHDLSKKICCNIGECGLGVESRCNKDSYCCPSGHSTIYKGNLCQCNAGSWTCSNTAIKTDYSRILFSKNSNKHETTLEVSETELRDINSANAKVLVFFDKSNYNRNLKIKGSGDCSFNLNKPIENKLIEDLGGVSTTGGFSCKLEITVDGMDEDEYFFYTGSTLVLEYIY